MAGFVLAQEQIAANYLMQRLGALRLAQQLPASAQFDLARSDLTDDDIEEIVDQFRDSPQPREGWGMSEILNEVMSREPRKVSITDMAALQRNLIANGYASPLAQATGTWDPEWYGAFRRFDRDNREEQMAGDHWYSAPVESGIRGITNTLPSRVFQGIVGAAKGTVMQAPETLERGGALGGAAVGAGIGAAAGAVLGGVTAVPGAAIGAAVGGVAGFLADFFGEDEREEDQGGAVRLLDALQPFNEYVDQGPKAFFEDLGFTLTAASLITGAGIAAKGAAVGAKALSAARFTPGAGGFAGAEATGATAIRAPMLGIRGAPEVTTGFTAPVAAQPAVAGSLARAALQPVNAVKPQLGVFGTLFRAAEKRFLPGTHGFLARQMERVSPIAFVNRLGPNIGLKVFGGLSQAQMGARMFGGFNQGSNAKFGEARDALEAELGRDLTEDELGRLSKTTSTSTIEKAIANAPLLKSGIETPLGDLVDLAAFALYPERLLPFKGASVAKSAVRLLGDTQLAPYAHALRHQNPKLAGYEAVRQVKEYLSPIDNAWLRADFGINREALDILDRSRLKSWQVFLNRSMQHARADVIRQIRREYDDAGKSELLERVMTYSHVDPTDFERWLISLNGQHRGMDRLTAWKQANILSAKVKREVGENTTFVYDPDGNIVRVQSSIAGESTPIAYSIDGKPVGEFARPTSTPVKVGGVTVDRPHTNIDMDVLKARTVELERRAKKYESVAAKGTPDPNSTIALSERARLARAELATIEDRIAALKGASSKTKVLDRFQIVPARLDFADKATVFEKRKAFLELRDEVLNATKAENPARERMARVALADYVDGLAKDGFISDAMAASAKIGKPSDRIAKALEKQAKSAGSVIELPPKTMKQFADLGYKPVNTGEDVLMPDQLEQMIEVTGIGDYTRRAYLWESIGLSPRLRSDKSIFQLRREHEIAELTQVLESHNIQLSGAQAMRRLHQSLADINHDGAVIGPLTKGKTTGLRLYKVDVRDLSMEDVLRAFKDTPGVTEKVAGDLYGALRRGAAYGGELKLMHPIDSAKAIGHAMRINGLPGFSDVVRTWHSDVPTRLAKKEWRNSSFVWRPPAEVARSSERAKVVGALKDVAAKANVTEVQRNLGMMFLDNFALGQVRVGRFATVDDFYRSLDVAYVERFIPTDYATAQALFRRVGAQPDYQTLRHYAESYADERQWYEKSARALAALPFYGRTTLGNGNEIGDLELFVNLLAAVSPQVTVGNSVDLANAVFRSIKSGDGQWPRGTLSNVRGMLDDIVAGKTIDTWGPARTTRATKAGDTTGEVFHRRQKVENFYQNLMGDLDRVTNDVWMSRLFGYDGTLSLKQYDDIATDVRALADDLGWKPAQVQSALRGAAREQLATPVRITALEAQKAGKVTLAAELRAEAADIMSMDSLGVFTPKIEAMLADLNGYALMQTVEDQVMGLTQFGPEMNTVMRFFKTADFSTLVHENAHLLRRLLPDEDIAILEKAYGLRSAVDASIASSTRVALVPASGAAFRSSTDDMLRRLHSDDMGNGFTWDPHTGKFVEGGRPGAGTSVATGDETLRKILPDEPAFTDPAAFEAEVAKIMREQDIAPERLHVGGWMDDEGIHLDIAEVLSTREAAQQVAVIRKQKAVFDLSTFDEHEATLWTRAAEERFAEEAGGYLLGKIKPGHSRGVFDVLKESVGGLWKNVRPVASDKNLISRGTREVIDKHYGAVYGVVPDSRTLSLVKDASSRQALGGAALGAGAGALEGDSPQDILQGALGGAAVGMLARAGLRRTYGYLPDALAKMNTALRYTLSFTFDAGRYSEQNLLAMKVGLPGMLKPKSKIMSGGPAGGWKTPFRNGTVEGEEAWNHAIRFWDELNGTSWFQNIDDTDRRLYQAGLLGFAPRNFEAAQAFMLYQRGWDADKIIETIAHISRYGLGRTAAEKSANFIVFPFSFSKKLIGDLGDFLLQAPGRNLLLHEGMRRYQESELDEGVNDFIDKHAPILRDLWRINNLAYGLSPGRFFLQGLDDQRSVTAKAMQIMASFFVPSGSATPLAQAAGGLGDLAINAFTPLVVTGESINRAGGIDSLDDILKRYIPFTRELDQYFNPTEGAVVTQGKAFLEGAAPDYQFQSYLDERRIAKAELEPLAFAMGYTTVDGFMASDLGILAGSTLDTKYREIEERYPTGFQMAQQFENKDAVNQNAIADLGEKANRSAGEDAILDIAEEIEKWQYLSQFLTLDPQILQAIAAESVRRKAEAFAYDRRFAELWDRFFTRQYGPIRRIA